MTNFPETGSTSGVHLETFTIYIYTYIFIHNIYIYILCVYIIYIYIGQTWLKLPHNAKPCRPTSQHRDQSRRSHATQAKMKIFSNQVGNLLHSFGAVP